MIRHILFTGEVGCGKSTALSRTLALLDVKASGIETYSDGSRKDAHRTLYMRPYAGKEAGIRICRTPGEPGDAQPVFDCYGVQLLARAKEGGGVIVIEEIGRLEREASAYQAALQACFDGEKPVLGTIRKHKASWADWIRQREDVMLLEVTQENRDGLPEKAAQTIRKSMKKA